MAKFTVKKQAHIILSDIIGSYNDPNDVAEWKWIEDFAEHICKDNGQLDMWDFMVNVENLDFNEFELVPASLKELFKELSKEGIAIAHFTQ